MLLKKLKIATALFLLAGIGLGAAFLVQYPLLGKPPEGKKAAKHPEGKTLASGSLDKTIRLGPVGKFSKAKADGTKTGIKVIGLLEGISVEHRTVTVILAKQQVIEGNAAKIISTRLENIPVTKDARIRVGDKKGKLSDLQETMSVALDLAADTKWQIVVVGITAQPKGKKAKEGK